MQQPSQWSKALSFKEQRAIIKRLFVYARPFRKTFSIAILFSLGLAAINILLPRILQTLIDRYLQPQKATSQIIWLFAALYLLGTILKAIIWFFQW